MASAHNAAAVPIPDWKWSPKEKAVASRAFDLALSRELQFRYSVLPLVLAPLLRQGSTQRSAEPF